MVWGRTSDREEQRARGDALTAAYRGPAEMPVHDRPGMSRGSHGGAPIWNEGEAWMPGFNCACDTGPRTDCPAHANADTLKRALRGKRASEGGRPRDGKAALLRISRNTAEKNAGLQRGEAGEPERNDVDLDGLRVFGRFPRGYLNHLLRSGRLGVGLAQRDQVLHVCSGTLSGVPGEETPGEAWTVDIRAEARPRVQADGRRLPFRDASWRAVLLDPPYSDEYARNLYGVENPRPSWLLREAARVVAPGGRIGILHVAVPFAPPGCALVRVWGVTTGVGFRIRALTVYQRHQDALL